MERNDLLSELDAASGREMAVWVVLYEDIYETAYGDGYYAYLADAFFTGEEAEQFAATPGAYRFHIRQARLSCRAGQIHLHPVDLKPFETIDLTALIAALSHDPTPRKPKTQY